MSDYKLVNFGDAEDMAAANGVKGIEAKFLRDSIESEHLGVSRFRIAAGNRPPFGHRHREQEEAYVITRGSGRFKLEDEIIDVREGDVLRVAPHVMRAFEAGPDGIDIVVVGNDRPEGGDGDMVPNWWTD